MTEKVYITSQQTATFTCPKCQRSKTVNVPKYADMDKVIKVRVRCPCGHDYTTILEKRRKYRKATNLPGTYIHYVDDRPVNRGLMSVKNISTTGMKLKLTVLPNCTVGDLMEVEFRLDNVQRTLIRKKVIIRNISGGFVGVELAPTEAVDQALGFYLFS